MKEMIYGVRNIINICIFLVSARGKKILEKRTINTKKNGPAQNVEQQWQWFVTQASCKMMIRLLTQIKRNQA